MALRPVDLCIFDDDLNAIVYFDQNFMDDFKSCVLRLGFELKFMVVSRNSLLYGFM